VQLDEKADTRVVLLGGRIPQIGLAAQTEPLIGRRKCDGFASTYAGSHDGGWDCVVGASAGHTPLPHPASAGG